MQTEIAAKQHLKEFLLTFPSLSPVLVEELVQIIPVIAPVKGTVLTEEGEVPNECYYVLQGMVRQYEYLDGIERTTEFYTEANGTVSSAHYTDQTPSKFNLICEEDCLLVAGNIEIDEANMQKFPVLLDITRQILEQDLNKAKENFSNYILSSPKERYLQFMKSRPDLLNRVPQHQIASYLGITPESLSRIRKRLMNDGE